VIKAWSGMIVPFLSSTLYTANFNRLLIQRPKYRLIPILKLALVQPKWMANLVASELKIIQELTTNTTSLMSELTYTPQYFWIIKTEYELAQVQYQSRYWRIRKVYFKWRRHKSWDRHVLKSKVRFINKKYASKVSKSFSSIRLYKIFKYLSIGRYKKFKINYKARMA